MYSSLSHRSRFVLLVITVIGVLFMLPANKAEAAYSGLPDMLPQSTSGYRPYVHLSYNVNDADNGVGAWSRTTTVKVYTKTPGTYKNVYLQIASGSCPTVTINAKIHPVDDKRNILGSEIIGAGGNSTSSNCSNILIAVPSSAFTLSNETGGKADEGVYVAALRLRLDTESEAISFRFNVDANQARLGVMGVYPNGGSQEGTNDPTEADLRATAYSLRGGCNGNCSDPGNYNVTLAFAAPCTFFGANPTASSSKRVSIFYKDLDSKQPINNGQPVSVSLEGRPNNGSGSWGVEITQFSDDGNDASSIRELRNVEIKYDWQYRLTFSGMDKRNGVRLWFPFDSAGADFNCPDPAAPTGTLGVCTTTIHFGIPSGSQVDVKVYARTSNDSNPFDEVKIYDKRHGSTDQLDLGDFVSDEGPTSGQRGLANLQTNNGFWVLVRPLNSSGNPTPSGSGLSSTYPADGGYGSSTRNWGTGECFRATCTVTVNGSLANGGLRENSPFGGIVTTTNITPNDPVTGNNVRIPGAVDGVRAFGIRSTGDMGTGTYAMADAGPGFLNTGSQWTQPLSLVALGGRAYHTVKGVPAFINRTGGGPPSFDIGPECGPTVPVYQEFNMNQSVDAVADDIENPTSISATANIFRNGYATDAPLQSGTLRLYRQSTNQTLGTAAVPAAIAGNVAVGPVTYTSAAGVRAAGWVVGENYCASISYNYQHGWWGPAGNGDITDATAGYADNCDPITNRPYISAYGGDVGAGGGGLGLPCSNSGNISSYFKNAGSGAQYAAYAMESISGFKSAFLRDASYPTAPRSPNDLTFGNTPSLGQYKLVDCATDFYSVDQFEDGDSRKNTAIPGSISAAGLSDGGQSVRTGNLTLNGGGFNGNHSIFVDGDVFITGNIAYTSTSWANIAEIPYFNLVVRGNIYISQDVTQLDGRYIAQPRSATEGGHIYTCAYAGGANAGQPVPTNPGSELWNQCGGGTNSRRLVINGQFVARTVHFLRTINTLSDGVGRETVANSRAGEVFNLSPEIFLGQPATRPKSTSTSGEYQNITVLPPIL